LGVEAIVLRMVQDSGHPGSVHVVRLLDSCTGDGIDPSKTWLYLQLHAGDLRALFIQHGKVITPRQRIQLASDICSGAAAIHSVGYAHDDLKMNNILWYWSNGGTLSPKSAGPRAVVTDLGLAKPNGTLVKWRSVGIAYCERFPEHHTVTLDYALHHDREGNRLSNCPADKRFEIAVAFPGDVLICAIRIFEDSLFDKFFTRSCTCSTVRDRIRMKIAECKQETMASRPTFAQLVFFFNSLLDLDVL
jgi:serine/threonine protein kinase